jgi:fructose-1,6-bisphosphatase
MQAGANEAPKEVSFKEWCEENKVDNALFKIMDDMNEIAFKEIAEAIKTDSCDKSAMFNEFGDEQLSIDLVADEIMFKTMRNSGCVAAAISEETTEIIEIPLD